LDNKKLTQDDHGPYGALIVLASKPHQNHVHWGDFGFQLCNSFRPINAKTRPFKFPITRCDNAVEEIGDREITITLDLDSGYWQVKLHEDAKEKTAFFTPEGNKHRNVMPMRIKNAQAFFVAMVIRFKKEWTTNFGTNGIGMIDGVIEKYQNLTPSQLQDQLQATLRQDSKDIHKTGQPGSAVIVDDIILYAWCMISLLAFFVSVCKILKHYRVTAKLRKARFLPSLHAEFVGIEVLANGNSPAQSKYDPIKQLGRPELFTNLRMLIGLLGFFQTYLPLYEHRITPWRLYQKDKPIAREGDKEQEAGIPTESLDA
jgi:hypothetical protein